MYGQANKYSRKQWVLGSGFWAIRRCRELHWKSIVEFQQSNHNKFLPFDFQCRKQGNKGYECFNLCLLVARNPIYFLMAFSRRRSPLWSLGTKAQTGVGFLNQTAIFRLYDQISLYSPIAKGRAQETEQRRNGALSSMQKQTQKRLKSGFKIIS